MPKKTSVTKKKKTTKVRASPKKPPVIKVHSDVKIEKVLVENFVSLQKVMTNLTVKFDNLANQISKLLELFEISAKTLAKKDFDLEKKSGKIDEEMVSKIDNLLDQNKTIARGLTLLHEPESRQVPLPPMRRPPQAPPGQKPVPKTGSQSNVDMSGYQKSIPLGDSSNSLSGDFKSKSLIRKPRNIKDIGV